MLIYYAYYLFLVLLLCFTDKICISSKSEEKKPSSIFHSKAYSGKTKINEIIFVTISFLLLILLLGLRSPSMGIDLDNYLPSFYRLNQFSWNELIELKGWLNYEKGYIIYNKIIGQLKYDSQFFLFACAVCSILPIGFIVYHFSKKPILSIYIYLGLPVFLIVYSGLRQGIAIGITIIAFYFVKERKLVPFILIVLLASTFHTSAFAFIFAYPLYHLKLSKTASIMSVFLLPLIWIFKIPIFLFVSKFYKDNISIDNNGATTLFLIFSLIYIFSVAFGNSDNKETNGLSNLFWIACAIQAMGGIYSTILRLGYYYMIYLILLLPEVLDNLKNSNNKKQSFLISCSVYLCFIIYGLYSIRNGGWAESYPYCFYWNNF